MVDQPAEQAAREEVVKAIRTGFFNRPFSRCSYCGKDWNGGEGHEHPERDWSDWVMESKGGTVGYDPEQAADAVLTLLLTREQAARDENRVLRTQLHAAEKRLIALDLSPNDNGDMVTLRTKLAERERDELKAQLHAAQEALRELKAWPHQCALEACCIENGVAALSPRPPA